MGAVRAGERGEPDVLDGHPGPHPGDGGHGAPAVDALRLHAPRHRVRQGQGRHEDVPARQAQGRRAALGRLSLTAVACSDRARDHLRRAQRTSSALLLPADYVSCIIYLLT